MKLTKVMENGINGQINMEFKSAYTYLAMSAYCERIKFPGCASWLRQQAGEEKGHAMKLYDFLRERDATIELLPLPAPPQNYKSITDVFEKALKAEEAVSASINDLYELAFKEKTFATAVELQWFLKEQVEEEKTARDILAKFQRVSDDPGALLDLDNELGARAGSGEDEEEE
ncbi:MAG: ferritin [Candidatus Sumerlaeaceae bacterium]|nr:ferritin [Candidatus Sumerlaeaceae bacterium]